MIQLQEKGFDNLAFWKRGIDPDQFSPDQRQEEFRRMLGLSDEKILLYVGRISAEKELDVLMEAAEDLNRRRLKYKLVLVGDGPYRQELESREIPNVIFLGYKSGKELQCIYASSDIFVFPSSSETYGNVILEAMASGLSVVAPYAGGIKENLIDRYNGLAFAGGQKFGYGRKKSLFCLRMTRLAVVWAPMPENLLRIRPGNPYFTDLFKLYLSYVPLRDKVRKLTA
jgi:glycosyltransferase involved in cell wall biosynthesis